MISGFNIETLNLENASIEYEGITDGAISDRSDVSITDVVLKEGQNVIKLSSPILSFKTEDCDSTLLKPMAPFCVKDNRHAVKVKMKGTCLRIIVIGILTLTLFHYYYLFSLSKYGYVPPTS